MPSYSSRQFFQDWRYAIEKDFATSAGDPYPYAAASGKREWGDEARKIVFEDGAAEPNDACISGDGSRLAVAVKHTIHIVDTTTWETTQVIRGHTSQIDALAFQPDDANVLVSSEQNNYAGTVPTKPTVFVWQLDELARRPDVPREVFKAASNVLAGDAVAYFSRAGIELRDADREQLETLFEPVVTRVVDQSSTPAKRRFDGRLRSSFQANVFSPSGKWMLYLPGEHPRSNGNAPWHMVICSTADEFSEHVTLKGHTDAIMWTGWSSDEKLFGSVAWDRSMRIWDAVTGKQIYKFETDGQNWTGGFSPDAKLFIGTCGQGTVHIYDLSDGSKKWVYGEHNSGWWRALDWHPNSRWVAVGRMRRGTLVLLDVEEKKVLQERQLSSEAARPDDEEMRSMLGSYLETSRVCFMDGGNKLAYWTGGDSSIEVFDVAQQVKWRFGRGGTDPHTEGGEWVDEKRKVTSKGGHGMVVMDGMAKKEPLFISIDFDGLRVWTIKETRGT
ncbi:WD40 repeat-like protein [Xylariaceae sp. FL1651]|nr:WD40 repeat-like protein [Xylariaceae sp. FL1651]